MGYLLQAYRLANHYFREPLKGISPHWDECYRDFIAEHPTCAACGATKHLAVHHVKPIDSNFWQNECDFTNLITLCYNDHLLIGHGGDFNARVPDVRQICEELLAQRALRPLLEERAHRNRVYIYDFGKKK